MLRKYRNMTLDNKAKIESNFIIKFTLIVCILKVSKFKSK